MTALDLFLKSPFKLEKLLLKALRRQGFQSLYKTIDGYRLHYIIKEGSSSKPPLVFIHGIAANAVHWQKVLVKTAKSKHTVIAIDLPSHGFSDDPHVPVSFDQLYEALVKLLKSITHEKICVVGNSLGGALSLRLLTQNPEMVKAAIVISPPGAFDTVAEWKEFESGLRLRNFKSTLKFLPKLYDTKPWYLPLLVPTTMRNFNRRGIRELLSSVTLEDTQQKVSSVKVPLLFVWGRSEKLLPAKQLQYYKTHLPKNVVIEEPEGIGHCPQLDRPEWLANRILTFFDGKMPVEARP